MQKKANKTAKKKTASRTKAARRSNRKTSSKQAAAEFDPARIQSFRDLPEDYPLKLVGLIGPDGKGGGSSDGRAKTWTFSADLIAWRPQGGPVIEENVLLVCRKISERKLSSLMKSTPNLAIIEFEARRPAKKERPKIYPQAERFELIKLGKKVRDAALQEIKTELQKPVEYRDAVFGILRLNRECQQFETNATFRGNEINVTFETQSLDELQELIRYAKALWRKRQSWFSKFRIAAYEHYVKNMEDNWWEGDEELTKSTFLKLLGWPVAVEFRKQDGEFCYLLGGWSEELYTDHGIDAFGRNADEMEIEF